MYRNALVATDGSRVAAAILQHVAQVVDASGTVLIVQVIDDEDRILARTTPAGFEFGMGAAYDPAIAEAIVRTQRETAEQHLATARLSVEEAGIAHVEERVLAGLPGDAIVRQAVEGGHDVVLMGTHGRSGVRRVVLGSVADHVLRHLDGVPVLLIHAEEG